MKKVLIVGGVAGGASTATRLRRLNEDLEIILFEKGQHVSFANCGLPYHIGGVIENRESLLVQTPESLKERFNLDVRVNSEVISVNSQEKSVVVKTKNGEEYKESFDYLVLAPGAKPLVPPIDGISGKNIYTLRNVTDLDKIMEKIRSVKEAIVIGGGFIGVEVAENLQEIGITTTLIEAAPSILAPFDSEMSNILETQLASNGVNLLTNNKVIKFQNEDEEVLVSLENGNIRGDIVILAIGVSPDTKFLNNSGINLGERGHILVNEHLETNIKDIYALGDAILVKHFVTGQDVAIALAGPANRQGRIVAGNISGRDEIYKGSFGTSIIKVFKLTGGATGLNERSLKALGKNFEKIYLHPNDHAGYYPGATPISIKLLYEKETKKVLGAQAIGFNGVDKFIDIIATTLKFKGTIDDLAELDLAYAPPYSSAKSPANMSGFIGQNIEDGLIEQAYVKDLENFDKEKQIILDIREELELIGGKFENSINIPISKLRERFFELPKDKEILTYCAVGLRGYIASRFLMSKGYKVKNIAGGFKSKLSEIKVIKKEINNEIKSDNNNTPIDEKDYLNLSGLSCPGPLVKIKNKIDELNQNDILKVKVTDPGFYNDIQSWAKVTKNRLVELKKQDKTIYATLQKGLENEINNNNKENKIIETNDAMTIVVFSGDLDKAIAAFVIANGALAMGKKVTMFFTFWGLSILRKKSLPNKSNLEKIFDMMLPKNSKGLPLSKMNFFGMGSKMIRDIMNRKNIMSLEELMKKSIEDGANLVACTMSMDVMGIKEEELIDGISFGGVGQYLGEADKSNNNLFI